MNGIQIIRTINAIAGRVLPGLTARLARRILMTPRRLPARPWEEAAMGKARRISFSNGLSGLHWGATGPVVLCLHGWEGRASQFARFAEPLTGAGFQVISLDAPAHGESPGREANPLVFMEGLLEAGRELHEENGPLHMVIGHSMGAGAAALAVSRGLPVRSAVLIAGPSGLRNVLRRFAGFIGLPKKARQRFYRIVEQHTNAPLDTVEIQALAADFNIPGLVVHDRDDPMMPFTEAGEVVKYWQDARLLVTTGLGHHRALRNEHVIGTVVCFAREVSRHRNQLRAVA